MKTFVAVAHAINLYFAGPGLRNFDITPDNLWKSGCLFDVFCQLLFNRTPRSLPRRTERMMVDQNWIADSLSELLSI